MQAVIPMAGYGTRLRPHTYSRPKPLLTVGGQPILQHLMDGLEGAGIDEYIFVVGYLGEQIEQYVKEKYDVRAHFVEQTELLGQAHAIHLCKPYLNGPCVILFSDTLFESDLSGLRNETADGVAYVKQVEDPRRFGVAVPDENGRVKHFIEKPASMENRLAVVGLYYIRDSAHMLRAIEELMERNIMTRGEYYLADAFQIMIDQGAHFRIEQIDVWLDCGKPETVLETNRYLLSHGHCNVDQLQRDNYIVIPPVHIGPNAHIESAVIGPYVSIGANCKISNSIIRDSIIDDGARIHNAMLEESLIGCDASLAGRFRRLNVGDSSSVEFI
jgi:glucose-1-phosphate thymidylyltransferase